MDELVDTFSNRLKKAMSIRNIKAAELSQKTGIAKSSLSEYINGKYEAKQDGVYLLSKALNVSEPWLMGLNVPMEREQKEEEIEKELKEKLKLLQLDKSDLEKAIIAFMDNYMLIKDNPRVNIYNMEDSIIYYAYELITKYYFKLINRETTYLSNNLNLLKGKQDFFEKAEELAWNKMKDILDNIYDADIISNLTAEEKAMNFISKLDNNNVYMCPIYGQISAGQPNWAEECVEGKLPIDPELMGIVNPEEHYFLRVNGESMNKVVKNGAFALIHKQDYVENGEIAVVLVNGDNATLKRFSKQGDIIVLTPESTDENIKQQIYTKETPIKVIGKYVGKMEINK